MTSTTAAESPNPGEKLLLGLLAAVNFTHIMDFMIMMPLGPKLERSFGITTTQFGMLVSAYSFSAGAMGFLAGFFIDRFDRKRALLALYAGFLVGTFACAIAPNFHAMIVARIIAGGFGGVAGSVILAIVGDVIPESRRGRAMGVIMLAFSMATILGLPIGLKLADAFGWHAPFFFLVIAGLGVLLTGIRVLPSVPPHRHDDAHGILARMAVVVSHADHLRAFALMMTLTAAGGLIYPLMSLYNVHNAGYPEDALFLLYLIGGTATFFTSPLFGKLSDLHGKARLGIILAVASAIPTLIATHLPVVPMLVTMTVSATFMVLASGRFVPLMALITGSVEPKYRGAFMSVNSSIQQISAGIATIVASYIVTENADKSLSGFGLVGVLSVALLACCIPLTLRLDRARRAQQNPA